MSNKTGSGSMSIREKLEYKKFLKRSLLKAYGFAPPLNKIILLEAGQTKGYPDYVFAQIGDKFYQTGNGISLVMTDSQGHIL
jgi:hypothetical protein